MTDNFRTDDITRLLNLSTSVAQAHNCTISDAVAMIEKAVAIAASLRPPRSVSVFADCVRRLRLSRNDRLGANVFRDPAWDMMLDLLVAQEEQRDLSVSQLCIGSGAPATTALRYISRLEKLNIVERSYESSDARLVYLKLNEDVVLKLHTILGQLRDCA